ncbi:MAG: N-acetylmuramoyl-L-alanine amidase [Proteobacteria bacterium]|nr:N-acetylmuramoyl-L-alanine amidase [Desulfobacula sp.]MBU3951767.1 N-acetylmuramoyl-L-alanine amidase [Pseudomonadota bacterium]MBU4132037.1 N-acetylmuramoyl-L-alanine amidase [Pseudomonadota bacterium]
MERFRSIPNACMIICMILCMACFATPGQADSAKEKYLDADNCFKKLRNSTLERQKISGWLNCIHQYETIYKDHPESSWAPAGMYKATELYLHLFKLSGNIIHQDQAMDLMARIRNRYPQSAYNGKANILLKSLIDSPDPNPIKTIRSKKQTTRNESLIDKFNQEQTQQGPDKQDQPAENTLSPGKQEPEPENSQSPSKKKPLKDTRVTDLRFWSNPEYTRIVINASDERDYSHRLLKKDPIINKPYQRLYIDIENARLGKDVAEQMPINDDLLNQARAGQYLPHTVRVVVDIKSFENYKIFSLKDPFRIIIDVWGKGSNGAPLEPSLAQKDSGKKPDKTSRLTTDNLKSSDIARQLALGVRKIIIDPGHGGTDPGAPGYIKGVWEKDIVLKLALNLAQKLRDRLKCTVELTRSTDIKLTLEERTAMANTRRADLFISMHCNAAQNKNLTGFETYILNLATDEQAIAVAARENATSKKNISDLEYILSDLMKHAKIEESTRLANDVHKAMIRGMKKKHSNINDLGVKQAPFYVLLGARMPSILIEASFISNQTECKRLLTESYRNDICTAITDGIEKYIDATNPRQL